MGLDLSKQLNLLNFLYILLTKSITYEEKLLKKQTKSQYILIYTVILWVYKRGQKSMEMVKTIWHWRALEIIWPVKADEGAKNVLFSQKLSRRAVSALAQCALGGCDSCVADPMIAPLALSCTRLRQRCSAGLHSTQWTKWPQFDSGCSFSILKKSF